jgi:hypothetical protein
MGPALILLNKYIMEQLGFSYPMFLSGIGTVFSGIFANVLVGLGVFKIENPSTTTRIHYYTRILPIALSSAGYIFS